MQIEINKTIKLEVTEVNPEFAREIGHCIFGVAKDGSVINDVIRAPNKVLAAEAFINKHIETLRNMSEDASKGAYEIGFVASKEFEVKLA